MFILKAPEIHFAKVPVICILSDCFYYSSLWMFFLSFLIIAEFPNWWMSMSQTLKVVVTSYVQVHFLSTLLLPYYA